MAPSPSRKSRIPGLNMKKLEASNATNKFTPTKTSPTSQPFRSKLLNSQTNLKSPTVFEQVVVEDQKDNYPFSELLPTISQTGRRSLRLPT